MGCCCHNTYQQCESPQTDTSNLKISDAGPSRHQATKYREEGQKYYNTGDYAKAVSAYKLALMSDPAIPANYTNLALAYKAKTDYAKSIQTIGSMQDRFQQGQGQELLYMVKGAIIRARCACLLLKSRLDGGNPRPDESQQFRRLIEESVDSLTVYSGRADTRGHFLALNGDKYLTNCLKFKGLLALVDGGSSQQDTLFSYFAGRFNSAEATTKLRSLDISQYFAAPEKVLGEMRAIRNAKQPSELLADREQQFSTDPIFYQTFRNPIIVESGLTYEESTLLEHYGKNGSYDPITRQPLRTQLGVRNRTLLALIDQINKKRKIEDLKALDL